MKKQLGIMLFMVALVIGLSGAAYAADAQKNTTTKTGHSGYSQLRHVGYYYYPYVEGLGDLRLGLRDLRLRLGDINVKGEIIIFL